MCLFFLLSLDRITCLRLIDCFLISPGDGIGRKNRSYLFLNGKRNEYCEQKILFQGLAVLILKKKVLTKHNKEQAAPDSTLFLQMKTWKSTYPPTGVVT